MADGSAKSLVSAVVGKLDGQDCNRPRETSPGLRGDYVGWRATWQLSSYCLPIVQLLWQTPGTVKSDGTSPRPSLNPSSFPATLISPTPNPHPTLPLVFSQLRCPVTGSSLFTVTLAQLGEVAQEGPVRLHEIGSFRTGGRGLCATLRGGERSGGGAL